MTSGRRRQGNGMAERNIGRRALAGAMLSGLALTAFAACSPIYENHGYTPGDAELSRIVVGRDTRSCPAQLPN